jgi:BlaI family penicillinase repressor
LTPTPLSPKLFGVGSRPALPPPATPPAVHSFSPMTHPRDISLTKLESEVMSAVWTFDGPVRVREVAEAVNAGRREPLAYTTVQSVLTILKGKGAIERVKDTGRAHAFRARVSRDEASRGMMKELADRLFGGRVEPLLLQMIGQAQLKPEELAELRAWVDEQLHDTEAGGPTP